MIIEKINELLPDWALTKEACRTKTEIWFYAEKGEYDNKIYSVVKACFLPSIDEYFSDNEGDFASANNRKDAVHREAKKLQNDILLQRKMIDEDNFLSIRETFSAFSENDLSFLSVIRYENSISLFEYIDNKGITEGGIVYLGICLLKAISGLKEVGLHHGSICPECISVVGNNRFVINSVDSLFSLGRSTPNEKSNAFTFADPIFLSTGKLKQSSDAFSVAAVMYWLLNDKDFVHSANMPLPKHCENKELTDIVMKGLASEKENRFSSAKDMRKALEQIMKTKRKEIEGDYAQEKKTKGSQVQKFEKPKKNTRREMLKTVFGFALICFAAVVLLFAVKTVKSHNIENFKAHIASAGDFVYSGEEICPDVTIEGLPEDTYTVEYSDNNKAGLGKITIKGKKLYYGTKTKTFKIKPSNMTYLKARDITDSSATLYWDASLGAEKYKLYVYNEITDEWDKVADLTEQSYTFTNLLPDREYQFRVKGVTRLDKKNDYVQSDVQKIIIRTLK